MPRGLRLNRVQEAVPYSVGDHLWLSVSKQWGHKSFYSSLEPEAKVLDISGSVTTKILSDFVWFPMHVHDCVVFPYVFSV